MHGERGTLQYDEDKRKYVGGFKNGAKHGQGEYYFPNGSRCVRRLTCVCGCWRRLARWKRLGFIHESLTLPRRIHSPILTTQVHR